MSRHRNVRSMNYSDEYDGYDDVYGHSVEDDYCMSPSEAAFMYDREGSKNKQKMGAFFQTVNDIAEENEGEAETKEANLSEINRSRLESCLQQIKQTIGSTVPRQEIVDVLLMYHFNIDKAINFIMDNPKYKDSKQTDKKEKGFKIPKLNGLHLKSPPTLPSMTSSNNFSSLSELTNSYLQNVQTEDVKTEKSFSSLAELTYHQFSNSSFNTRPSLFSNTPPSLPDISSMQISNSIKPINTNRNSLTKNWHVDLSKALRASSSAPQVQTQKQPAVIENFKLPFTDCETMEIKESQANCSMDMSGILLLKYPNAKKVSKFGKMLCRKYKRSRPYIFGDDDGERDISRFLFDSPSPDDIVSRNTFQR